MRLALSKALAGCLAVLSVATLSACGGTSSNSSSGGASSASTSTAGKVVEIYSSLPLRGPEAADGDRARQRDQARAGAGPWEGRPVHGPVHAARRLVPGAAGWDASQTAANARKAAADPQAVYYIGEFDDDASEVSMPILNQAGIAQVSPANMYVGPDHERARKRLGSAELRADRHPHVPADRADRLGPGRCGPAGDASGGLHQGRAGQRQRVLRHRPGQADRGSRRATTGSTSSATPPSTRTPRACGRTRRC